MDSPALLPGISVSRSLCRMRRAMLAAAILPTAIVVPYRASANVAQVGSWGIDRIDQRRLPLDGSYTRASAGAEVLVYVVDTGVRADHDEFIGRVAAGANFSSDRSSAVVSSDCHGHGTFVSAIIAGRTLGVSNDARIVPVRAFNCKANGWASEIARAIRWVVEQHPVGRPGVINLSLAMPRSNQLDLAVATALDRGISVVAASGNNSGDACVFSPGNLDGVITVAASQQDDSVLSMSNQGRCVDVFAPGAWVTSAWIGSAIDRRSLKGTSFAAPHVTGAVARLLGREPKLSPGEVQSRIVAAATPGVLTGVTSSSPNLLLFVGDAVAPTPTTTVAPTTTTVAPTTTTVAPTTTTTVPPPTTSTLAAPPVPSLSARRVCCGNWQISVAGLAPFEQFAVNARNASRRPPHSITWLATADERGNAMFFVRGVYDRHQFSLVRSGE